MPLTFTKIASVTVGSGGASSITFSGIPATFTDLQIVGSARSTTTNQALLYRLNGSATGYTGKYLGGTGSVAESSSHTTLTASAGGTWGRLANAAIDSSTDTANTFSSWQMYIPNYTSANFKSISFDAVTENNATTAFAELDAKLWSDTAAITSVAFGINTSGDFVQHSTATLYGIKSS